MSHNRFAIFEGQLRESLPDMPEEQVKSLVGDYVREQGYSMWEGGACNPTGITHTLNEMCSWLASNGGTDRAREHAGVKLALDQLCYLVFGRNAMPPGPTSDPAFNADLSDEARDRVREARKAIAASMSSRAVTH